MFRLTYQDKTTKKEEVIYGNSEEHCIDKYRRTITALSDNYKVLSIVNEDEEEKSQLYENYLVRRDEEAKRVIGIIEKTVQSMIKKPYTNSSKKRNKTIRTTEYICRYVRKHYCDNKNWIVIDEKVEVSIGMDKIYISPTDEWYERA